MPYVTLARDPTRIGRVIAQPWLLPGHYAVQWIWAKGHQWRSPQVYPAQCLKRLEGDFEALKREILERVNEPR